TTGGGSGLCRWPDVACPPDGTRCGSGCGTGWATLTSCESAGSPSPSPGCDLLCEARQPPAARLAERLVARGRGGHQLVGRAPGQGHHVRGVAQRDAVLVE